MNSTRYKKRILTGETDELEVKTIKKENKIDIKDNVKAKEAKVKFQTFKR